jgi:ABC-2 type transport system permease protein
MNPDWRKIILQLTLAIGVAVVLLFASATTSTLHDTQRKIHAGASKEPQLADPAAAAVEIVLETSPLAQLSAGFTGIAPSMHMIRMSASRPLSNIDPIEHPARRRFGRVDFSFAFLVFLPLALIPLCYFIYRKCMARGDVEKLTSGRSTLFDFSVERILLPLLASFGFVALVTLACLYSAGLRLGTNELLSLMSIWVMLIGLYLLAWILLFAYLLLRSTSFSSAVLQYSAVFLALVFLLPQLSQTIQLSIERPKGRLPLIVERRKATTNTRTDDRAGIDRYLQRKGYAPLDWSTPLPEVQASALLNMRVEEAIAPKLVEFETSVKNLDNMSIASSWLSPYLVAQYGVDDIAGTGLSRYSNFRTAAIEYHEQWRKYTLGFLAKRQFLDYDALRNIPKFKFTGDSHGETVGMALIRCGYFALLCLGLALGIGRELKKILPKRKRAAR